MPTFSRPTPSSAGHVVGAASLVSSGSDLPNVPRLNVRTFTSPRHTTRYLEAGPVDGPLMVFLHGWPQIGLMWRSQVEAFASQGWRCVAPDMRGYGGSSAPTESGAYALSEIVEDMVELHDHLGARPAIWVGHDWGSPVAAALAAHHRDRSRGVVLISVPYFPKGFALPNLLPLIDRQLYPIDRYPDGQWDYFRFYLTHFNQAVSDFEGDIPAALASTFRPGNPASAGLVSPSALITQNGGRYGSAHRAPPTPSDPALWPSADFDALVEAFQVSGLRPANAWYLNDRVNMTYANAAPDGGRIRPPVLFVNGEWDPICDINRSRLGEPMRDACRDLFVTNLAAGHWLPLERKTELVHVIRSWLELKGL
ncbi:MAG: alpha/beta hydrolase family protein [Pseudomonas sp.]|uniref:alpha/beta hydrolase n=1 Tax=Pseudomonas sp. TaxID=306 RepID=UPI00261E6FB0|nr:alpha/beta hydrolase [Pseudomonas sp.]MDB6050017.1 alpha/beta hydrolase family protein [Pseudomonas sp.]